MLSAMRFGCDGHPNGGKMSGHVRPAPPANYPLYALRPRCAGCGYPLCGLPEPRCPECGLVEQVSRPSFLQRCRAFAARHRRSIIDAATFAACVAAAWTLFARNNWLLIQLPVIVLLFRRQWVAAALFLLCTPTAYYFFDACYHYRQGSSQFVPARSYVIQWPRGNVDPTTRVLGLRKAWCGTGADDDRAMRAAKLWCVPIMHALVGPPPGAYLGPYPTKAEAVQALNSGGQRQDESRMRYELVVGSTTVPIASCLRDQWGWGQQDTSSAPTAAIFKNRCLVVRVPRSDNPKVASIHLIDVADGRNFAMYWDTDAPDNLD
jgi:hypothetical protein